MTISVYSISKHHRAQPRRVDICAPNIENIAIFACEAYLDMGRQQFGDT